MGTCFVWVILKKFFLFIISGFFSPLDITSSFPFVNKHKIQPLPFNFSTVYLSNNNTQMNK